MIKEILRGMLVLLMVSLSSTTVPAQSEKVIVAVDNGYPPYMYGTKENAKGLYPEQIKAVFSRIGVEVDVQALPWKRALRAGEEGTAAVGGIYKNKKRLKIYDYSQPIFEETLAIYVSKGAAFPFRELSDLEGKNIGINRGWSYGEAFDNARKEDLFRVQEANTNQANFQKLVSKRIDCFIVDQLAASQIIRRKNLRDKVEKLEQPAAINKAYIVFSKSMKKKELLFRFNRALSEMKEDGSYEKIVKDFITESPLIDSETIGVQNSNPVSP